FPELMPTMKESISHSLDCLSVHIISLLIFVEETTLKNIPTICLVCQISITNFFSVSFSKLDLNRFKKTDAYSSKIGSLNERQRNNDLRSSTLPTIRRRLISLAYWIRVNSISLIFKC